MQRRMKKSIATQNLITEQTGTPHTGCVLPRDELDRLTAVFSLLISIDQKNKAKEKANQREKK